MSAPRVSVIIPCYNAESFIKETIDSVISQSFTDFEILIIDDGSVDRTSEIVRGNSDSRIKYHHKANSGVADSRNVGIRLSKGEYIAFLDADDLFFPTNLERKVDFLDNDKTVDLVHSWEKIFKTANDAEWKIVKGCEGIVTNQLLELKQTVIHSPSSVVCRRTLLESSNGFDSELSTSADWELWVRLSRLTPFSVIPEPLVAYRIHSGQMHLKTNQMEADMLFAFRKLRSLNLFKNRTHYRTCLSRLCLILAASFFGLDQKYLRAAKYLSLSIINNPLVFLEKVKSKIL